MQGDVGQVRVGVGIKGCCSRREGGGFNDKERIHLLDKERAEGWVRPWWGTGIRAGLGNRATQVQSKSCLRIWFRHERACKAIVPATGNLMTRPILGGKF